MTSAPSHSEPLEVSEAAVRHMAEAMRPSKHEQPIQTHLCNAFQALGLGAEVAVPIGGREADIVVTDRNTVVGVQATGTCDPARKRRAVATADMDAPDETQLDQLDWYVRHLAARVRKIRGPAPEPYYGILTDGQSGYVWEYGPAALRSGSPEPPKLIRTTCWQHPQSTSRDALQNLMHGPFRTATGKPWAQDNIYATAFAELDERAKQVLDPLRKANDPAFETKFALWDEQMRGMGLAPDSIEDKRQRFAKHTFLVAVAKCVIATLQDLTQPPNAANGWHGIADGFQAWLTQTREGQALITDIWDAANRYDWKLREGDVLRHLYEDCIDQAARKRYGEYYTPDWLAEMVTERVLDDEWVDAAAEAAHHALVHDDPAAVAGIGVLDPTCGSGTFLFHAAHRLVNAPYWRGVKANARTVANAVATLVHGIDIHPVATELAKATVLRALPAQPTVELQIAQGDCLLVDRGQGRLDFEDIERTSPLGRKICIPRDLIVHPQAPTIIPRLVKSASETGKLPRNLPRELQTRAMAELAGQLGQIDRTEESNVWAWWLRSLMHPDRIALRKVDRVLANPPWVPMRNIAVAGRKDEMISLAQRLEIWPKGKLATTFDICGLVMVQVEREYLANDRPTRSAYLTNHAALQANQWLPVRRQLGTKLHTTIALDNVRQTPFTGAPCAVLEISNADRRRSKATTRAMKLENRAGQRAVARDDTWAQARSRTRLVADNAPSMPARASGYLAGGSSGWRQGATIVPYCLLRLERASVVKKRRRTTGTTMASRHEPWDQVGTLTVDVPSDWVVEAMNSGEMHPFAYRELNNQFIVPRSGIRVLTEEEARAEDYWQMANQEYERLRKPGKHTPPTLLTRIDYNRQISKMLPRIAGGKHIVFHNNSGQHFKAARAQGMLGDASVHYLTTDSAAEAQYLCCVLNATVLQLALTASRESNRHFSRAPWRKIPVPRFDRTNTLHRDIAAQCRPLEELAGGLLDDSIGTLKQDRIIREAIAEHPAMKQLNGLVRKLLPQHTTNPAE